MFLSSWKSVYLSFLLGVVVAVLYSKVTGPTVHGISPDWTGAVPKTELIGLLASERRVFWGW